MMENKYREYIDRTLLRKTLPIVKEIAGVSRTGLEAWLDRYFYKGYSYKLFTGWKDNYDIFFADQLAYFIRRGKFFPLGDHYIDGQAEAVIMEIMKRDGADMKTIDDVLNCKKAYKIMIGKVSDNDYTVEVLGKSHPWVKEITMTDEEMVAILDKLFYNGYYWDLKDYWMPYHDFILKAVLKYFLQTGKFIEYGHEYIDGQAFSFIYSIMKQAGADVKTIVSVLNCEQPYKI